MSKPDLRAVLGSVSQAKTGQSARRAVLRARSPEPERGYREGTVGLTIHIRPETRRALKGLAAAKDTTVHKLVLRGLNAVFAEEGLPENAE